MRLGRIRRAMIVAVATVALTAMAAPVDAHPGGCLLAIHVGGIQQHLVCR